MLHCLYTFATLSLHCCYTVVTLLCQVAELNKEHHAILYPHPTDMYRFNSPAFAIAAEEMFSPGMKVAHYKVTSKCNRMEGVLPSSVCKE